MVMNSFQHGVYQNIFHLTWQTKCRYKVLRKEKYRIAMRQVLEETAQRHGMCFVELAVMPDHVHSIVDCHPSVSQTKALNLLKGAIAHEFFKQYPRFRLRYPKGHF